MAFSIRFTEGVHPGKKLQTLKRSAKEIYDASAAVLTKGLEFQTSWMKDRPWLFHDEETDR
jgi:hypothetical protein